MKKILLIIVVVILVAAGGAGVWWLLGGSSNSAISPLDTLTGKTTSLDAGQVADLYKSGDNKACNFDSVQADGTKVHSSMYFSKGRSYTVVDSFVDNNNAKGYNLYVNEMVYTWQDGSKDGTQFPMPMQQQYALVQAQTNSANGGANVTVDAVCKDWAPDESYFQPPTDVKFMKIDNPSPPVAG